MKDVIIGRLKELRHEMKKEGISWYIVPTDDFHMSEYVGDYFKEREFLSGFNGSAGTLLVGLNDSYLWTDGRYFLACAEQLNGTTINLMKMGEEGVPDLEIFLKENVNDGDLIGYDGRTMSFSYGKHLRETLKNVSFKIDLDLVGNIWHDRPSMSKEPIYVLDTKYTGKNYLDKLNELKIKLSENNLSNILLTSLDEICYLLNIRGNDVLYTPVCLSYMLITNSSETLYINKECLTLEAMSYFSSVGLNVKDYFEVYNDIKNINSNVLIDPKTTNEALYLLTKNPVLLDSPIKMMKAIKNVFEIENERLAHIKDGVALTKTIYWLKKKAKDGSIYNETELSVEKHLTDLRKENENFISLSFESIVATGKNSPIVHYEPTVETDTKISEGFLLIDTGGQYLEGTTDVTRTISLGHISREMKLHYTLVLKGHIDLGTAIYPKGTYGAQLDIYARRPLWKFGLDFNHGTGHGVGYLLGVHEGPNSIRKGSAKGGFGIPIEKGMIMSDEPGVYFTDKYGIRIENMFLSVDSRFDKYYTFDMLTLVPYDKASIDLFMLDDDEIIYLKEYSKRVYDTISPYLNEEERMWLKEETTF